MSMQRCGPSPRINNDDFEATATVQKAMADPHRLTTVVTLASNRSEVCVHDFTKAPALSRPTVPHHPETRIIAVGPR